MAGWLWLVIVQHDNREVNSCVNLVVSGVPSTHFHVPSVCKSVSPIHMITWKPIRKFLLKEIQSSTYIRMQAIRKRDWGLIPVWQSHLKGKSAQNAHVFHNPVCPPASSTAHTQAGMNPTSQCKTQQAMPPQHKRQRFKDVVSHTFCKRN